MLNYIEEDATDTVIGLSIYVSLCRTTQIRLINKEMDEMRKEVSKAKAMIEDMSVKLLEAQVKKQLSYEFTKDKLLHYMSEWCGTPKLVQGACCYEDCAVENDLEDVAAKQALRERLENCYLRIPHCIKGTVPESIQQRLRLFYSRTFWGNINVFKCGQAAQALAKRGLNVVRMFIGLSSGGVGQSLYSTHLQAMYAHNFAFFDPQIWFNEEEMRKQVEQPNGCIILTGQEAPASGRPCSLALRLSFCCCVFGF